MRATLAAIVIASIALPARANPCKADVEKFCKEVTPGGGRLVRCLQQHEAELSEACRAQGQKIKERVEDFTTHCKADIERLCKGVRPGGGRVIRCLRRQPDQLSEQCKEAMRPGGTGKKTAPAGNSGGG